MQPAKRNWAVIGVLALTRISVPALGRLDLRGQRLPLSAARARLCWLILESNVMYIHVCILPLIQSKVVEAM